MRELSVFWLCPSTSPWAAWLRGTSPGPCGEGEWKKCLLSLMAARAGGVGGTTAAGEAGVGRHACTGIASLAGSSLAVFTGWSPLGALRRALPGLVRRVRSVRSTAVLVSSTPLPQESCQPSGEMCSLGRRGWSTSLSPHPPVPLSLLFALPSLCQPALSLCSPAPPAGGTTTALLPPGAAATGCLCRCQPSCKPSLTDARVCFK